MHGPIFTIMQASSQNKDLQLGKGLAIFGAGHLGQLIAHHAGSAGMAIAGFYDDTMAPGTSTKNGTVLGPISAGKADYQAARFGQAIAAVGYKHFAFREKLYNQLVADGIPMASVIHPSAYVDAGAHVGPGCVLLPGCVLDDGAHLEANVLLNTGCTIAHDSFVGAHSFFGPGVPLRVL